MKFNRRIIANVVYIILGAVLLGLGFAEVLDAFWSGMGGALIAVGVIRFVQILRYSKDEAYREEKEIEAKDERNQFLRNKACSWATYLFILIAACATIAFRLLGQDLLSQAASFAICILLVLYWLCYAEIGRAHV